MIANAHGKIFRANAILRERLESFLNNSVFKRMKSYNRNAPADFKSANSFFNRVRQNFKFAIDFNPNCLKNSFGRVPAVFSSWRGIFDNFYKHTRRFNRGIFSSFANGGGDSL